MPHSSTSIDGLRLVAHDVFSDEFAPLERFQRPFIHIETASIFELLDLVVCLVIALGHNQMPQSLPRSLMAWFADPRHLSILRLLLCAKTSALREFALGWVVLQVKIFYYWGQRNSLDTVQLIDLSILSEDFDIQHIQHLLLYTAACSESVELLKALMQRGFDFNSSSYSTYMCGGCFHSLLGEVLLHGIQSPQSQVTSTVRFLLQRGANITKPCWETFSALDICALKELPVAKELRSHPEYYETPIARVARLARSGKGHLWPTEDVAEDHFELTLYGAVALGCVDLVDRLLSRGTDPSCPSLRFDTRYHKTRCTMHSAENLLDVHSVVEDRSIKQLLMTTGAVPPTARLCSSLWSPYGNCETRLEWEKMVSFFTRPHTIDRLGVEVLLLALRWRDVGMLDSILAHAPIDSISRTIGPSNGVSSTVFEFALRWSSFRLVKRLLRDRDYQANGRELILACLTPSTRKGRPASS